MSQTIFIPLNQLKKSPKNARKTPHTKEEIQALAASIHAKGLLQNLVVEPERDDTGGETGCYLVTIGEGRRLAYLHRVKLKQIGKDEPIRCLLDTENSPLEISLDENVNRSAMKAMDEVEAFAGLIDEGRSVEDIAQRFGHTVRHVEQRLALARLSPKIRTACRKGDVTLDVARAFCITDDHREQERVFKQLSKPITHPQSVRQALTQGRVPANHRLARFVGLEEYRAAGGRITSDFFEDGIIFLDDGELVQRLAGEKAETLRNGLLDEGWGWAEVLFGHGHAEGLAAERLSPRQRRLTPKEKKEIAALEAEIERLDAVLSEGEDDDAASAERDEAEAKLAALRETAKRWDAKEVQHAGALIAIGPNGDPIITRGLIKRGDLRAVRKLRAAAEKPASGEAEEDADQGIEPAGPRLPKSLNERLTLARTRALRADIAKTPHVALALLVSALAQRSFRVGFAPGVAIENAPVNLDDAEDFERGDIPLGSEDTPLDPAAHLALCLDRPTESLIGALAALVAETVDFTHRGAGSSDARLQAMADALAAAVDLDMRRHWQADESFWEKAPKSYTMAALDAAPAITMLTPKKRAKLHAEFAKMKRSELAGAAAKKLQKAGWLPELLITPAHAGAFAVTADGEAAANAIAAE
ncbi:MAG: ParB/RepB/Spo0J family partition protein [Hyphomonadaceae bacterium]